MGRCKTCQWWKEYAHGPHLCQCPKLCLWLIEGYRDNAGDDFATVECEGGFHAIETGPEFGCVHWEGKNVVTD